MSDKWTITSVGKVDNPSGTNAADLERTLTAVVPIYPLQTQPLAFNAVELRVLVGHRRPVGLRHDDGLVAGHLDARDGRRGTSA